MNVTQSQQGREIASILSQEDFIAARKKAASTLAQLSRSFYRRGWLPATSGNFSIKLNDSPLIFAITATRRDKSNLSPRDVLLVNGDAQPVEATDLRPSDEAIVHSRIYQATGCGAVLHVHSVYSVIVSEMFSQQGAVEMKGLEILKALGLWNEEDLCVLPIVENLYALPDLAALLVNSIREGCPAALIKRHGVYVWGRDAAEAKKHLETFEYLFQYLVLRSRVGLVE